MIEYGAIVFGVLGLAFGANCWWIAHRWARDCSQCRILIARKGRVVLDAPLVEWLAWNRALPHRERGRGGIIFHANGIQVALARPKIGAASATQKTTKGEKAEKTASVKRRAEAAVHGTGPRSTTQPRGVG